MHLPIAMLTNSHALYVKEQMVGKMWGPPGTYRKFDIHLIQCLIVAIVLDESLKLGLGCQRCTPHGARI